MLGYVTIGVSDMAKAEAFYGALLAELGAKQLSGMDSIKFYGTDGKSAMLAICTPYDGKPAESGNGNMIAIPCKSLDEVNSLYAKAIELGASDEGEPGQRFSFFYGAYVRDADNNKLCFYRMTK